MAAKLSVLDSSIPQALDGGATRPSVPFSAHDSRDAASLKNTVFDVAKCVREQLLVLRAHTEETKRGLSLLTGKIRQLALLASMVEDDQTIAELHAQLDEMNSILPLEAIFQMDANDLPLSKLASLPLPAQLSYPLPAAPPMPSFPHPRLPVMNPSTGIPFQGLPPPPSHPTPFSLPVFHHAGDSLHDYAKPPPPLLPFPPSLLPFPRTDASPLTSALRNSLSLSSPAQKHTQLMDPSSSASSSVSAHHLPPPSFHSSVPSPSSKPLPARKPITPKTKHTNMHTGTSSLLSLSSSTPRNNTPRASSSASMSMSDGVSPVGASILQMRSEPHLPSMMSSFSPTAGAASSVTPTHAEGLEGLEGLSSDENVQPEKRRGRPPRGKGGCSACGTVDTPQWRMIGGKRFCNACGLGLKLMNTRRSSKYKAKAIQSAEPEIQRSLLTKHDIRSLLN
eukprot:GILK01002945.1.p1 GENE.GILK01002945.1~~GILK01002945.1.p1  ORF type:complete len:482 (+),score=82.20 GILK01002945.1:97-1446(+)